MKTNETTVIVRTMNNSDIISKTLKSLFSQSYKSFDLLVVDSGSKDDTLEQVSFYKHKLIQIKPEEYHPGIVLNNAVRQCQTELIVFLNSDTVMLHNDCLKFLILELQKQKNAAVFARQIARPEAKPWVKRDYELAFPNHKTQPSWMYFSLPLSGIRKSVWENNPFYEEAWASEDTKMGVDLQRKKLNVKYVHKAIVMHSHNYTLKQIYNRRFVEGEADAFIFSNTLSVFDMCKLYLSSLYNDMKYHLKTFEFKELSFSLVRRFIYQYAYYKGHTYGKERQIKQHKATYGNYQ